MTRALFVVLLLGAALRVVALDKPLYVDEMTTITVATQSFANMPGVMRQIDASPGLYPILLHLWLTVSHADVWTRLLSALCGMTLVWVVFLLGRRAFDDRTGLAAAFVVAIAPVHVEYAQYVRGYSLFTLLAAIQMLIFLRCMVRGTRGTAEPPAAGPSGRRAERGERWGWGTSATNGSSDGPFRAGPFVALALVTTALFYTHYLSLLILAPEGLYTAFRLRDAPKRVFACGGAVAMAGLLFLPGVPLLKHNLEYDAIRNEKRDSPPPATTILPNLFVELSLGQRNLGFSNPDVRPVILGAGLVVFGALLSIGVVSGWRRQPDATMFLVLAAALPIAIYVLSGRKLVHVRFFIPFSVAYLVLVARGIEALRRPAALASVAALTILGAIPIAHFARDFSWSYDHRAVARAIGAKWQPGDAMLFVHPYEMFYYRWYLGADRPMKGLVFTALEDQPGYQIMPDSIRLEVAEPRVMNAARTYDRLWVIGQTERSYAAEDPVDEPRLFAWMDQTFGRLDDLSGLTGGSPYIRLYRGKAALSSPGLVIGRAP